MDSANATPTVTLEYSSSCTENSYDVVSVEAAGNSGYQYDSVLKMWQFNWKTTANSAGCYNIYISQGNLEGRKTVPFPLKVVR